LNLFVSQPLRPALCPSILWRYAMGALAYQSAWVLTVGFLPARLEQLGATPSLMAGVMSLAPMASAMQLPMGHWGDQLVRRGFDRLSGMSVGTVVFTIGAIGLGFAPSLAWTTAMVVVLWLGTAILETTSNSLLAERIPDAQRTLTMGWVVALRSALTLVWFGALPYLAQQMGPLPYAVTAITVPAGCYATLTALQGVPARPSPPPPRRAPSPSAVGPFFRTHILWMAAIQAYVAFMVLFVEQQVDLTSIPGLEPSHFLAIPPFVALLVAPWVHRAVERWGQRRVLDLALGTHVLAGAMAYVATTPGALLVPLALSGVPFAVLCVLPLRLLTALHRPDEAGHYAGRFALFSAIALLAASGAVGLLVEQTHRYADAFLLGAALAVAAAVSMHTTRPDEAWWRS